MPDDTDERLSRLERQAIRLIGLIRFVVAMVLLVLSLLTTAWFSSRGWELIGSLLWVPAIIGIWAFDKALDEYLTHGR